MINYAELDNGNDKYEIFKDKDGIVYKIGIPSQRDLIKIGKFQFVVQNLQEEYNKAISKKKLEEKAFDELDRIYTKLIDLTYGMFLFVLNLNGCKEFILDDIKSIPFEIIQSECNSYMKYVQAKMGN